MPPECRAPRIPWRGGVKTPRHAMDREEVGVGIVHLDHAPVAATVDPAAAELHRRLKAEFDPTGRLNPGIDVLGAM